MGTNCEICFSEKHNTSNNGNTVNRYDEEYINANFYNFIFQDKFIDFIGGIYKLNDPIFKSFHKDEKDILENFYNSKKNELQNNIYTYLENQNLNFVNILTKQIISNENGTKILEEKIKNEI